VNDDSNERDERGEDRPGHRDDGLSAALRGLTEPTNARAPGRSLEAIELEAKARSRRRRARRVGLSVAAAAVFVLLGALAIARPTATTLDTTDHDGRAPSTTTPTEGTATPVDRSSTSIVPPTSTAIPSTFPPTSTSPPTSTPAPPSSTPVPGAVALRIDGFASVPFGTVEELAVREMTDQLGPPDRDSGWEEKRQCGNVRTRTLSWGAFRVWISDMASGARFAGWSYGLTDDGGYVSAANLAPRLDFDPPLGLHEPDASLESLRTRLTSEWPGARVTLAEFTDTFLPSGEPHSQAVGSVYTADQRSKIDVYVGGTTSAARIEGLVGLWLDPSLLC
jgi:hypothetical protein